MKFCYIKQLMESAIMLQRFFFSFQINTVLLNILFIKESWKNYKFLTIILIKQLINLMHASLLNKLKYTDLKYILTFILFV